MTHPASPVPTQLRTRTSTACPASLPAWRERTGPEAYRITREARPAYDHPIADQWHAIGTSIYQFLDSQGVKWTSIDPVAFAEEGGVEPFCPLLMWIGVHPKSLIYDAAVAAAGGFPEIEVAFRESVINRSVATGPKLLPFNPLRDPVPELLKPFTPTLGLSIAPLKTPYYEGTGALYLRVGNTDKRTVLLTAAHVARPGLQQCCHGHAECDWRPFQIDRCLERQYC